MIARMAATARTIPKTYASLAGSGFGAMCPLLAPDRMSPCRTLEGLNGKMCELLHTSAVVQEMRGVRAMLGTKIPQPFDGPGQVSSATGDQFGPSRPASSGRAEPSFVA